MGFRRDGVAYFLTEEVLEKVRITRQTLWRWRRQGLVPAGHRSRDRQVVFTSQELGEILEFANRLQPIISEPEGQLKLFNNGVKEAK